MWHRRGGETYLLGAVAALGGLLILYATRFGVGVSPDSVYYFEGAANLVRGRGYAGAVLTGEFEPIVHWPPGYPALLAVLARAGLDLLGAARLVAVVLFAANIGFAGWLVRRHGTGGPVGALAAALLVLVSLPAVHYRAWSEPLFILLGFSGLHFLGRYLREVEGRRWLVLSACLVSLATLTRYAGIALVGTGGLALLLLHSANRGRRALDALVFGVVGAGPAILWRQVRGSPGSDVSLGWHPVSGDHLGIAVETVFGWVIPAWLLPDDAGLPLAVLGLFFLLLIGGVVVAWSRGRKRTVTPAGLATGPFARILGLYIAVYLVFLLGSISFAYSNISPNYRMLAPAQFAAIVLAGLLLGWLWRAGDSRRGVRAGAASVLAIVLVLQGATALRTSWRPSLIYNDAPWREATELWSRIQKESAERTVYSNAPDAIFFHTGAHVQWLPQQWSPTTATPVDSAPRDQLCFAGGERGRDVIVHFTGRRNYIHSPEDLADDLSLRPLLVTPLATMYELDCS